MKKILRFNYLLVMILMNSPLQADRYIELSAAKANVNTPAANTYPLLADIRLGYRQPGYQLELAFMTSLNDDRLNQLTVDIPSVFSAYYHYLPFPDSSLKLHLIVGGSLVNIESSYPGLETAKDDFYGVSYGIGFEESFKSIPRLKLTVDWIKLYHGEQLEIDAASLGVHYEF